MDYVLEHADSHFHHHVLPMRKVNPLAEVASGEFDRRKQTGIRTPGIQNMERLFRLKPNQLKNYRANYSRKANRRD
jgi:hypothetical protein